MARQQVFFGFYVETPYGSVSQEIKGRKVLDLLGLEDIHAFRRLILDIVGPYAIDEENLLEYAKIMTGNKRKLQSHDFDISYEDMEWAFRYSLQVTNQ